MSSAKFLTLPPSPDLSPFVTALHYHSGCSANRIYRRLPGPFAAILIHTGQSGWWRKAGGTSWQQHPRIAVQGPLTRWLDVLLPANPEYMVALVEPWAVQGLLGIPVAHTVDRIVELSPFGITYDPDGVANLTKLASALEKLIGPISQPVERTLLEEARASAGSFGVMDVARRAGLSERTLRRTFSRCTGLNPKLWFEIERFSANLRRLHPAPWDVGKVQPSYFDQAHEIHDFRRFSGITPGAYAREKLTGDRRLFSYG